LAFLLASVFLGGWFYGSFSRFLGYFRRLGFGYVLGLFRRGLLVLLVIGHRRSLPRIWGIP